jgi:hypothetical protein
LDSTEISMTTKTIQQDSAGSTPADRVTSILDSLPADLDHAGDTVAGAIRNVSASVSSAPDASLLVGTSLAAGIAIGLLVGGGPRLFAAAAVGAAFALGASLAQRHAPMQRTTLTGSTKPAR